MSKKACGQPTDRHAGSLVFYAYSREFDAIPPCRTTGKRTEYRSGEICSKLPCIANRRRNESRFSWRIGQLVRRRDCDESLAGPVTIIRQLNERRSSGFRSPLSYSLDRISRSRPHACTLAHTDDGAAVSTRIKTASSVESARHSRESRLRACLPLAREQRIQGRESEHCGGATKKGERQGGKRGKERRREARLRVAKRVLVRTENEAVRASRTGVRFANARVGSFT